MKKIIISAETELSPNMLSFGYNCIKVFLKDIRDKTYGEGWYSCAYTNESEGLNAWAHLNKKGTVSLKVYKNG